MLLEAVKSGRLREAPFLASLELDTDEAVVGWIQKGNKLAASSGNSDPDSLIIDIAFRCSDQEFAAFGGSFRCQRVQNCLNDKYNKESQEHLQQLNKVRDDYANGAVRSTTNALNFDVTVDYFGKTKSSKYSSRWSSEDC